MRFNFLKYVIKQEARANLWGTMDNSATYVKPVKCMYGNSEKRAKYVTVQYL
jgi:hypothetical protein